MGRAAMSERQRGRATSGGHWARGVLIAVAVAGTLVSGGGVAAAQLPTPPPTPPPPAPTTAPPAPTTAPTTLPPIIPLPTVVPTKPPTTVPVPTTVAPPPTVAPPVAPTLTPAQLARQREQAAREAAQFADASERARTSWGKHAQASRMIIVRTRTVDTVLGGRLQEQVVRTEGLLTLEALARYVPDSWLSVSDGTARLSATVVLSPGTSAEFGGALRELELTGGGSGASASSIYTGGGTLTLRGITVGSADVNTGEAMPLGPGRPFIVVQRGGRLDATDTTITDLGTTPTDPDNQPGLAFTSGSTGSLVRTSVLRSSAGPKLVGSLRVRLDGLTVGECAGDGLVLQGDTGTTLKNIKAQGNKGNGVLVTGPSTSRPITGITTSGNGDYGVAVVGQAKPRISGVVTQKDGAGGIRLNRTTDASITDVTATDQPIGVYAHVGSARVTLDKVTVTGGKRGVVLDKTTTEMTVKDSTVGSASIVGLNIGGKKIQLDRVQVSDSRSALRIERGADEVSANGMTVSGGEDGIVAGPGSTRVTIADLTAAGVRGDTVRNSSSGATITGGSITGGSTGIDAAAATTITGTAVSETNIGIRSSSLEPVRAEKVDVTAIAIGVTVDPGAKFVLANSRVRALEAVRGAITQEGVNEISLPPLNLLAAIGLPLVLFALLLEVLHVLRQRGVNGNRRRLPRAVPAGAG
jgi:Right handed beta helix region